MAGRKTWPCPKCKKQKPKKGFAITAYSEGLHICRDCREEMAENLPRVESIFASNFKIKKHIKRGVKNDKSLGK